MVIRTVMAQPRSQGRQTGAGFTARIALPGTVYSSVRRVLR